MMSHSPENTDDTLSVDLRFGNLADLRKNLLSNVQRGGVFIKTARSVAVGSRIRVVYAMKTGPARLQLWGEVSATRSSEQAQHQGVSAGMKVAFYPMSEDDRQKIRQYFDAVQHQIAAVTYATTDSSPQPPVPWAASVRELPSETELEQAADTQRSDHHATPPTRTPQGPPLQQRPEFSSDMMLESLGASMDTGDSTTSAGSADAEVSALLHRARRAECLAVLNLPLDADGMTLSKAFQQFRDRYRLETIKGKLHPRLENDFVKLCQRVIKYYPILLDEIEGSQSFERLHTGESIGAEASKTGHFKRIGSRRPTGDHSLPRRRKN